MITVTVRHNFETAHRLYGQGPVSKCWNLHGHSFWCEVEVEGPPDEHGMVVEYGAFKAALRGFIDDTLDHGAILNDLDPLCDPLEAQGCKLVRFTGDPTVEAIARHLAAVIDVMLPSIANGGNCHVARVLLNETQVNSATWRR